eukprot:m.333550 g.333550  ORF g.333550 m.333550 type:complete len:922 (+) comp17171_c0_seq1:156-2921(+)
MSSEAPVADAGAVPVEAAHSQESTISTPSNAAVPVVNNGNSSNYSGGKRSRKATGFMMESLSTTNQLSWIQKHLMKALQKHEFAWPFLKPVDPVKLNLPTYFDVIKHPMDLSTVKKKLQNRQYQSGQEALNDLNLMFKNCYTFNRPGDDVVLMAEKLEAAMKEEVKKMPTPEVEMVPGVGKRPKVARTSGTFSPSSDVANSAKKGGDVRRPSRSAPRPATKETPGDATLSLGLPVSSGSKKKKSTLSPRMKFCQAIIRELCGKKHEEYAWPFYKPVDFVALGLHDYPTIIKKPMDLETAKKNLDDNTYSNADEFLADIRLIFRNCYKYNPPDHDVVAKGKKLEQAFEFFLRKMPEELDPPPAKPNPPTPRKTQTQASATNSKSRKRKAKEASSSSESSSSDSESADEEMSEKASGLYEMVKVLSQEIQRLEKTKLKKKKEKKKKKKKKKTKKSSNKAGKKRKVVEESDEFVPAPKVAAKKSNPSTATKRKSVVAVKPKPAAPAKTAPTQTVQVKTPVADESESSSDESEEATTGMSYEKKRELSQSIHTLPPGQLVKVVKIIKEMERNLSQDNEEIEIDFLKLKDSTLRALDKFMKDYKAAESKKNKKRPKKSLQERKEDLMRQLASVDVDAAKKMASDQAAAQNDGNGGNESDSSSGSSSSSSDEEKQPPGPVNGGASAEDKIVKPEATEAKIEAIKETAVPKEEKDEAKSVKSEKLDANAAPVKTGDVLAPVEPINSSEGVTFATSTGDGDSKEAKDDLSLTDKAPKIVPVASKKEDASEKPDIKVENESAWLAFTEKSESKPEATASDDFKKFQRLNEEKKEREKLQAEKAEQQRKEFETKQAALQSEAEAQKAANEKQKELEKEREAQRVEEEKAKRDAEAERLREEAKKEREAMSGHVDLHGQSAIMDEFDDIMDA